MGSLFIYSRWLPPAACPTVRQSVSLSVSFSSSFSSFLTLLAKFSFNRTSDKTTATTTGQTECGGGGSGSKEQPAHVQLLSICLIQSDTVCTVHCFSTVSVQYIAKTVQQAGRQATGNVLLWFITLLCTVLLSVAAFLSSICCWLAKVASASWEKI